MDLLSRAELFDLVWSHPRTTLATRFKVSDVAIAKKCRSANIPMPPPGYWARIAAGAKVERPVLPLRNPGERDLVVFGESRYESRRDTGGGELRPPIFVEDVDLLVDAAVKQLGRVRGQRDLADAHSGLARILRKEEQRRLKFSESQWSFYEPKHDDAVSQRILRLFNSLFRAFSAIGVKGAAFEKEDWKQGVGTTYRLSGGLDFGGAWVELQFVPMPLVGKAVGLKLLVGADVESKAHSVWSDEARLPLEKQLDSIARGTLVCAEQRMRAALQQRYELMIKERERRAREEEERRRVQEIKRAAEVEHEQELRGKAIHAAAARWRQSMEIRSFVAALANAHPELAQEVHFAAWCEFALKEADRIDPLRTGWTDLINIPVEAATSSAGPQLAR